MSYLLDTHTFLWFVSDNYRLSEKAKKTIENSHNKIFLSSAVVWEISIKAKIGKIDFKSDLDYFISECIQQYSFIPLPITIPHTIQIFKLKNIHKDPFDRILIAQSILESLSIITSDFLINKYKVKTIW